jgi:hypothetical protein
MELEKPKETTKPETGTGAWVDNRTFFEKYTLTNIIAEIRSRLSGK